LFQPDGGIDAKQRAVKRNQLRILPNGIDEMNQIGEFLEAE
jgi:hypothetical protein